MPGRRADRPRPGAGRQAPRPGAPGRRRRRRDRAGAGLSAYRQRPSLLAEEAAWSIEGSDLVRRGRKSGERRWPLATLTRAEIRRIDRGPLNRSWLLLLAFEDGKLALSSRSHLPFGPQQDLSPEFAAFCRELLPAAARAAPQARFLSGPHPIAGGIVWAMILLGIGAAAILLTAIAGGTAALALDLGSRLLFVLFLLAAALPWLWEERRRRFDPAEPPAGLLPAG